MSMFHNRLQLIIFLYISSFLFQVIFSLFHQFIFPLSLLALWLDPFLKDPCLFFTISLLWVVFLLQTSEFAAFSRFRVYPLTNIPPYVHFHNLPLFPTSKDVYVVALFAENSRLKALPHEERPTPVKYIDFQARWDFWTSNLSRS